MTEVFGSKGGKSGGGSYTTPEPPVNSLHSVTYAKVVDVISEGEINRIVGGSKGVYFDNTPLRNQDGSTNFDGVNLNYRYGLPNQEAVSGFYSVMNEVVYNKNITKLTNIDHEGPAIVTLSASKVDKVYIKIRVPELLRANRKSGKTSAVTLEFRIYKKKVTDSSWGTPVLSSVKISGVTTAAYEKQIEVILGSRADTWMIKVERLTDDKDTLDNGAETKKWDWRCNSILQSITEVTEARLCYPDTAYVALSVDASQFGDSIPARSYLVEGIKVKVPDGYNAITRTYPSNWGGGFSTSAYTNNPAFILRHILTNKRYGCGIAEEYIDDAELYAIAQYCDELVPTGLGDGKTEPRFTINTVLSSQEEVLTAISHITSVFNGMAYWGSNTITTVADTPSDPIAIVTRANVVNGEFNYSSSSIRERHSVALVTWNDPDSDYSQQVEVVEDSESVALYGWKTVDIAAFGCTSRGQAHRLGRGLLYSERAETEAISYVAGSDHFAVRPGDIIQVSDPGKDGKRYGGRILSSTTNTATLDSASNVANGDILTVATTVGTILKYSVTAKVDNTVTLSGILSDVEPGCIWQSKPTSLTNLPQYRVISVEEKEDGVFGVSAVYHDPNKYAYIEKNLVLPTITVKQENLVPKAPKDIQFSESLEKNNNSISTKLYISWADAEASDLTVPVKWSVQYRKDEGNWTTVDVTSRTLSILDVADGELIEVRVRSKSIGGKTSNTYASGSHTVLGKSLPPSQVENFVSTIVRNQGIKLTWDKVPDVDVSGYVIRTEGSLSSGKLVVETVDNSYLIPSESEFASDSSLFIWAVDTSENYSLTPTQLNLSYSKVGQPTVTIVPDSSTSEGNVYFRAEWNDVEATSDFDVKKYKVDIFLGNALMRSLSTKSTSHKFQVTTAGTYSVSVTSYDVFGQESLAGTASKVCEAPLAPTNLVIANSSGKLILDWGDSVQATLPIRGYLVSTSATNWSKPYLIYKGATSSKNVTESILDASSVTTFYVRAYDVSGNKGSISNITYTGTGIAINGAITAKVSDTSSTVATVKFKWPQASTVFNLSGYNVKLVKDGATLEESFVNSREWTTNLDWDGSATFSVQAKDIKGYTSGWYSLAFSNDKPNVISSVDIDAISTNGTNITIKVDWPSTGVRATLPIAGYEIRYSDSGWGTSGYAYRGNASQATLTLPLAGLSNKIIYIRAFDTEARYAVTSLSKSISVNTAPTTPTNLAVSYIGNKATVSFSQSVSVGVPTYEVYLGADKVYEGTSTTVQLNITDAISSTINVRAVYSGQYSDYATTPFSYTVNAPTNFTVTRHSDGVNLKATWNASSTGSVPIEGYIITAGTTSPVLVRSTSTSAIFLANWIGAENISIYASDANGVKSTPVTVSFTVNKPGNVLSTTSFSTSNTTASSYLNMVTLTAAIKGTFDVAGYHVRDTDTTWDFSTAPFYSSTTTNLSFYTLTRTFTKYVRAYDTRGNYSASSFTLATQALDCTLSGFEYVAVGSNLEISFSATNQSLVKEFKYKKGTGGWVSIGDATKFIVSHRSGSATFYIKAIGFSGQESAELSSTVEITKPSISSVPIITSKGVATETQVVNGVTTNKSVQRIQVDASDSITNGTYNIASYKLTADGVTVYNGASSIFTVSINNTAQVSLSLTVTDVAGNISSPYSLTKDKQAPVAPTSVSISASGTSALRFGVGYATPTDFRNFEYKVYKGTTLLSTITSVNQTESYTIPLNAGGTANITKAGVTYKVVVVVYDTSGNSSSGVQATKVLKLP